MSKIDLDPTAMDRTLVYKIVAGSVLPRPIGLISTVSVDGRNNVAPFSWFNALSSDPPYVCVSIGTHMGDGRPKDTLKNIIDTGEFVVNIVSEDIVRAQDMCAREYPADIDEFAVSGLTPSASRMVAAPAVLESRVNFECRLFKTIPLPRSTYTLVLGEIVFMRVHEEVLEESGRINRAKLLPVGRLAGNAYCRTTDAFTLDHDAFETHERLSTGG
jgi:flavin reductase (DIM6/NTAB) family NADH-FMN oxidoreductase RutF